MAAPPPRPSELRGPLICTVCNYVSGLKPTVIFSGTECPNCHIGELWYALYKGVIT